MNSASYCQSISDSSPSCRTICDTCSTGDRSTLQYVRSQTLIRPHKWPNTDIPEKSARKCKHRSLSAREELAPIHCSREAILLYAPESNKNTEKVVFDQHGHTRVRRWPEREHHRERVGGGGERLFCRSPLVNRATWSLRDRTDLAVCLQFVRYGTLRSVWVARKPPGFGKCPPSPVCGNSCLRKWLFAEGRVATVLVLTTQRQGIRGLRPLAPLLRWGQSVSEREAVFRSHCVAGLCSFRGI